MVSPSLASNENGFHWAPLSLDQSMALMNQEMQGYFWANHHIEAPRFVSTPPSQEHLLFISKN
jgi:hypothetical protein